MAGIVKIDILIPTYNRSCFLKKNLQHLSQQIYFSGYQNNLNIIVSDNASTDDTEKIVREFLIKNPDIKVKYNKNELNIGLEKNMVKLLNLAVSDYILWVGDDDYIAEGYLVFLHRMIIDGEMPGLVIPGIQSIDSNQNITQIRAAQFKYKIVEPSFHSVLNYSHYAHQMSGLLMYRKSLLEDYLKNKDYRNPYLFIFLASNRLLNYNSVYAPEFKTTVTSYNEKDWSYNQVGLLDEVYKSYLALSDVLPDKKITELLIQFTKMHSYRLEIKIRNPLRLINQYFYLIKSTPGLIGFKEKLAILLLKEYCLLIIRKFEI